MMDRWNESEGITIQLLEAYEGMIYHVLQQLHLTCWNPLYEDFLQEGRILLLECYQQTKGNPLGSLEERNQFGTFFKRKLYWSFLHTLTKKQLETVEFSSDWMGQVVEDEHWFEVEMQYHDFFKTLTRRQLETLDWLIGSNESMHLYALRVGRSRQAIQQDVLAIRKKLKKFQAEHSN